jgi:hypothetical protein
MKLPKMKKQSNQFRSVKNIKLGPSAASREMQIAAPILGVLVGSMVIPIILVRVGVVPPEDFGLVIGLSFIVGIVGLVGVSAMIYQQFVSYLLHRREYGFDKYVRRIYDQYLKPEDRLQAWGRGDKIQNKQDLLTKIKGLDLPEEYAEKVKTDLKKAISDFKENSGDWYLIHSTWRDMNEGFDPKEKRVCTFQSDITFIPKPANEQFVYGRIYECYFGPILADHPGGESDQVQVIGWTTDPWLGSDMPICVLQHSSLDYVETHTEDELKLKDAFISLVGVQQGQIEALKDDEEHYKELADNQILKGQKIAKLAHESAKTDVQLFLIAMKPTAWGFLRSGWFKVLMTAITVTAILILVGMVLGWIDVSHIFGG